MVREETGLPAGTVGGYRVLCEIGRGLRGVVYKAELEGLRALLRVLPPQLEPDWDLLERLRPGSASAVRHANLPPVYDFGREGRRAWVATRYLPGDSLAALVEESRNGATVVPSLSPLAVGPGGATHPRRIEYAARIVAETLDGLALFHRQGRAHLRIHPRNLIFTGGGRLALADLGIPPLPPAAGPLDASAYAAPELWADLELGSPRSDVYSIGAVLYTLVTGRPPFTADDVRTLGRLVRRGGPRNPRDLEPRLSESLEDCILCALSADPSDRYRDAGAFAADLRRALRGEPPAARRTRIVKEFVLAQSRRPGGIAPKLAAAALLALVLAGSYLAARALDEERIREAHRAALALIESGRYEEVLESEAQGRRLQLLDPGDPFSRVVRERAAVSAAAKAYRDALLDLAAGRSERAERTLVRARRLLPKDGALAELDRAIARLVEADPLAAALGALDATQRAAALAALRDEVAAGRRPPEDAFAALALLADPSPTVRALAFEVAALTRTSEGVLAALGITPGERSCLSVETFRLLYRTLADAGDALGRAWLDAWTLDDLLAIDRMEAGETYRIAGPLEIEKLRDEALPPYPLVREWLRRAARDAPEQLAASAARLAEESELADSLLEALESAGTAEAAEAVAALALRRYLELGLRPAETLARMNARAGLARLVRSELPPAYRAALVARAGRIVPPAVLAAVVTASPYPELRREAFRALVLQGEAVFSRRPEALASALGDPVLREAALSVYCNAPRALRGRLAPSLLAKAKGEVRRAALEALAERGTLALPRRIALLFAADPSIRRAAFEGLEKELTGIFYEEGPTPRGAVESLLRSTLQVLARSAARLGGLNHLFSSLDRGRKRADSEDGGE